MNNSLYFIQLYVMFCEKYEKVAVPHVLRLVLVVISRYCSHYYNTTMQLFQRLFLAAAGLFFLANSCAAKQPTLVVVLVYDQMRGDYLNKFEKFFGKKGFLRLRDGGAYFSNCHYLQGITTTCVGHSVIATGSHPMKTGIVGNEFWDNEENTGCRCVGKNDSALSPEKLLVPTFADEYMIQNPSSQSLALALKDRASIMLGGKLGKNVCWLDDRTAEFTTSSHYALPKWLSQWQKKNRPEKYKGKIWKTVCVDSISAIDGNPHEGNFPGGDKMFPHEIQSNNDIFAESFSCSPYSVDYLFSAAKTGIVAQRLGKSALTDFLFLGISTTDILGHIFGPDSRETQELYVHCDRILANFLSFLDAKIGLNNYAIVLTSDHGVGPIPEIAQEMRPVGLDAGRISLKNTMKTLREYYRKTFPEIASDSIIVAVYPPSLTFSSALRQKHPEKFMEIEDSTVAFLRREKGFRFVAKTTDILRGKYPNDWSEEICRSTFLSIYNGRTGNIVYFPKEFHIYGSTPASHGTPYNYDTHVPLLLYGNNILPMAYNGRVSPADIASTISSIIGIAVPQADGTVLPIEQEK